MKDFYKIKLRDLKNDFDFDVVCSHNDMINLITNLDYSLFCLQSTTNLGEFNSDITKYIKKPDGLETGNKGE